jgi:hypothetical protein
MASIQIVPLAPDDWVVGGEGGGEIGQFASQAEAEAVGRALARKRSDTNRDLQSDETPFERGRLGA